MDWNNLSVANCYQVHQYQYAVSKSQYLMGFKRQLLQDRHSGLIHYPQLCSIGALRHLESEAC